MSTNLFNKAKKTAPKAKAKNEKVRIVVEEPGFFQKVQKLEELNDVMKSTKAKADLLSDELRDVSKTEWVKLYSKTGKNPGSVMIEQMDGEDTAHLMLVPSDKYITVNEERAEELREIYGEEIIEEETTFSFDSDMINKYGEILSRLIEESEEISESDKENIIKATTKYSVTKGTIDNLSKYGEIEEVMESVKPVVSLKNIEVIKG
jgi:hypothetical protein